MTKYQVVITVPATGNANKVQLSTALITAYSTVFTVKDGYNSSNFPCARVFAQMQTGTTGVGFVGDSLVDQLGANGAIQLQPSTGAAVPGSSFSYETKLDTDNINLADYYIHGTVPGDKLSVWITVA